MVKGDIERGIKGFKKVYKRDTTNFTALGMLITFLRLDGKLDIVKRMLGQVIEKLGGTEEPGLCYCRGLYLFYRKNPGGALQEFQKASKNPLYRKSSLRHMIDIYLNPNQGVYYNPDNKVVFPIAADNFESIEILLEEIDQKYFAEEKAVLSTYINGLYKNLLGDAIGFLGSVIQERPAFTPALLCMAILQAKNGTIDKKTLRDISKLPWNPRWLEDSERGTLHVADFLISAGKFDHAEKELKRCIKNNKSSMKAMEFMGELYQKKENFEAAWNCYNRAWDISEKKDCWIGYRIAQLYFQKGNWVRSISIGNHVSFILLTPYRF